MAMWIVRALCASGVALGLGGCLHLDARPMTFTCGSMLAPHVTTYQPTPLFSQLQRDAGHDQGEALIEGQGLTYERVTADDPLVRALGDGPMRLAGGPRRTLMLSGGGSWGAFGAGFLREKGIRDWSIVTGISTGSLQALFVAAGDYDHMVREYGIGDEAELARANSTLGLLRKGSQYDIRPLRAKLIAYLSDRSGGTLPFERMARPGSPALFIGMVEAGSGDMKVVAVSDMVRSVYADGPPGSARIEALTDCVAGVTLASSSIPVRLTPVRIDGKTYFDGGVRSSVFDAGVAQRLAFADKASNGASAPELYVIRNGPTIVFRDAIDPATGKARVDARPDIGRVGLRGYSTIVNQSELMSIAALRLVYPRGSIRVMTADGFDGPRNPDRCGPRPEAVFDPSFMHCLIAWGGEKARSFDWIELDDTSFRRR